MVADLRPTSAGVHMSRFSELLEEATLDVLGAASGPAASRTSSRRSRARSSIRSSALRADVRVRADFGLERWTPVSGKRRRGDLHARRDRARRPAGHASRGRRRSRRHDGLSLRAARWCASTRCASWSRPGSASADANRALDALPGRDAQSARPRRGPDRRARGRGSGDPRRRSGRDRRELDVERDVRSAQAARRVLHRQQGAPQPEVRRRRRARDPRSRARRLRRLSRRDVRRRPRKSTTNRSTSTTRSPKRSERSASSARELRERRLRRARRPISRRGSARGRRRWSSLERGPSSFVPGGTLAAGLRDLGLPRADVRAHRRDDGARPARRDRPRAAQLRRCRTRSRMLGVAGTRYPVLWEKRRPRDPAEPDYSWARARLDALRAPRPRADRDAAAPRQRPVVHDLLDPAFPDADSRPTPERPRAAFPWVRRWTPINEPLTTARFSTLYGVWYPNLRDDRRLRPRDRERSAGACMRRWKRSGAYVPDAQFVLTEDSAKLHRADAGRR